MKNEIFRIGALEKDDNGNYFIIHVTQEINAVIVWFSELRDCDRKYHVDRVFMNDDKNIAIIYAVEKAQQRL